MGSAAGSRVRAANDTTDHIHARLAYPFSEALHYILHSCARSDYAVIVNIEISQLLLLMKVLFVDNLFTRNLSRLDALVLLQGEMKLD